MPGLATAHSHAFQRALRGRTQRRSDAANSFWSWRGLMYKLVEQLDPDSMYHLARLAYAELAMSGVTAVGEFHYVQHDVAGRPYANRTELAEAVIRAAKDVGLRICLIRTAYLRGGYQQELEPAQARFADPTVEAVLQDVDRLRAMFCDDPLVTIGLAAHSIRAVPIPEVVALADYAQQHGLPFHMHVAEQRREIEECQQEYGLRPVELLAEHAVLNDRFVAIHGTHLTASEIRALGEAGAFVCLCRTTERDLGDGLPHSAELHQAGVKLCVGVDSHASSDGFEEVRAVELDDRSRTERRQVVAEAADLLRMGTLHGYQAIGLAEAWADDHVYLRADDPSLVGLGEEWLTDGVIFGATPRAVDKVIVDGTTIVAQGRHVDYEAIRTAYERALLELGL